MFLSSFKPLRACFISLVILGSGGLAFWRIEFTFLLTVSACSASSGLIADSTLATISVAGMLVGVTAKFNPFCSKDTSASLKDLEDKLITHLDLST